MTELAKTMVAVAAAAAEFSNEDFGPQFYDEDEDKTPRAFYVQRDTDGDWAAAFRPAEDMDAEMTRWATGDEAGRVYAEVMGSDGIASQIADQWDAEWDV